MLKNQITVHMMIQNDEKTIKETLEHINQLNYPVVIVDCGSKDQSANICRSFGYKIIRMVSKDRSETRNMMTDVSKTDWQILLEPGEKIVKGIDQLEYLIDEEMPYCFSVLNNDIITKQLRMWKKGMLFKNPIYETIKNTPKQTDVIIISKKMENFSLEQIENWSKTNPTELEVYYYKALFFLRKGNYEKFLSNAEHYIFHTNKKKISSTMLQYYIALIKFGIMEDYQTALNNIIMCIDHNLFMAEFWCLLGDMYLKIKNYLKAKTFYENAIIFGSRRQKIDNWPMQISKYKSYPLEKIEKIKKLNLIH